MKDGSSDEARALEHPRACGAGRDTVCDRTPAPEERDHSGDKQVRDAGGKDKPFDAQGKRKRKKKTAMLQWLRKHDAAEAAAVLAS